MVIRKVVFIIVLIVVFSFVGSFVFSQDVMWDLPSFFSTPRQLSYGDARLLYPYDPFLFLVNPSILSYTRVGAFYLTKLSFYAGANLGYLYNTLNLASYNLNPTEWIGFDWNILTNDLLRDPYGILLNTEPEVGLMGPLAVGYVGNGIGILLYNDFFSSLDIIQTPGIPIVSLKSFAEVGITLGFSTYFDISKFYTLHLGISLSYSKRYKSPFFYGASALEIVNYYEKTKEGVYEYDVGDSFWGNVGLILDDGNFLKYSLNVENFFGRTFYWNRVILTNGQEVSKGYNYLSYIPPVVSLGAMFHLEKIPYIPTFLFSDFMVEVNLIDVFNFSEFWFKKVKVGAEISLLKIFKARGGINQGYITFGAGVDTKIVVIDISISQYEKSPLPGYKGAQNLSVSLELKF